MGNILEGLPKVILTRVFNPISFVDLVSLFSGFVDRLLDKALGFVGPCWVLLGESHSFNFGFFIIFSGIIFIIGAFGIAFNRKNVILLMVCVEIMFLGVNLIFISGYIFLGLDLGLVYALISLSVAAAEAAIGFSLLMSSFREVPNITFKNFNRLRG